MGMTRNVSLAGALRYKGREPMWAYILHRVGGLGMAIFITTHIIASFVGGNVGGFFNDLYMSWVFQIFIFFCVLFHAINGLRITILDLFPRLLPHLRQAVWIELAVFVPLYCLTVYVIVTTALGG